jgi:DNA (cytosine-5)-methyltransferase 1
MRYFSMFAGIGGFELGIKERGECVGYSEIDKYAIQIYQKHFPEHQNYGDAREIDTDKLPDFDLLVGGFPCQSFSIAGKRGGFEDTRGTLFFEIARIARAKRPAYLLLENVKGLLSHNKGDTFATIVTAIDELGYDCEWCVLNSKNFGVPQNRERVFIIGCLRGRGGGKVFPLGESSAIFGEEGGRKQESNAGWQLKKPE